MTQLIPGYDSKTARLVSSAGSINATVVANAAAALLHFQLYNASAGDRYLKIYDKATAPDPATDTPEFNFHLAPLTDWYRGWAELRGRSFKNGIAFVLTAGAADADATPIGAGDIICVNVEYD